MAAKGPRENITLECTECKNRNYMTSKNKRNNTDRRLFNRRNKRFIFKISVQSFVS